MTTTTFPEGPGAEDKRKQFDAKPEYPTLENSSTRDAKSTYLVDDPGFRTFILIKRDGKIFLNGNNFNLTSLISRSEDNYGCLGSNKWLNCNWILRSPIHSCTFQDYKTNPKFDQNCPQGFMGMNDFKILPFNKSLSQENSVKHIHIHQVGYNQLSQLTKKLEFMIMEALPARM